MGRDPLIIILVMRRVQNKRIMGIKGESVQRPASSNWRHYRIAVYGQDTHAAQRRTNCACMNWFRPSLSAKTHCLTYIYIYRRVRRRSVSSPMMIILHIATISFQAFFFFLHSLSHLNCPASNSPWNYYCIYIFFIHLFIISSAQAAHEQFIWLQYATSKHALLIALHICVCEVSMHVQTRCRTKGLARSVCHTIAELKCASDIYF